MDEVGEVGEVEVVEVPERHRFELRVAGEVRGLVAYRISGECYDLHHTEVDPELGGQGLGTRLVRATLDDLAERGAGVVPTCSFVAALMDADPVYQPLLER